jgi:tetratricopeptide (TPR) repeat protein
LMEAKGRMEGQAQEIERELAGEPGNAGLYVKLGDIYRAGGDFKKAVESYGKGVSLEPGNIEALGNLAMVYGVWGEYGKAREALRKVIEVKPDSAGAYYNMACMYAREGEIEESVRWLKEAVGHGFSDWGLVKTDKDLENIRGSAYYGELMKRHGSG